MKNIINLGLFVGILTCVAAQTTCNTAPAKKDRQYVGPNGVEDPTGDLWCSSHQAACGLMCNHSVLVNDCTRTKDDAAQTSTFCWACTCADGTVPGMGATANGNYGGTIPTLTCSRQYSNCLWEAANAHIAEYDHYMYRECRKYSSCQNDAGNFLFRYMDEPWSTVGSNPQPTTTTPVPATSAQTNKVSTTTENSTPSTTSSTTSSALLVISSSSSQSSAQSEASHSTTGSLTTSTTFPTQMQSNTTRASTTKTASATPTSTQFPGVGVKAVPHFAGIIGCIALFAAYM